MAKGTRMADETSAAAPSLAQVRARIDVIDSQLLALIDERAALARQVAAAKHAAGQGDRLGLKPAREAAVLRHLLALPRQAASPSVVVRVWRELIGESLSLQGPFHLAVWGGRDPTVTVDLARRRFGISPPLRMVERPEDALAAAKTPGGVAVAAIHGPTPWWGRLLAEPRLKVFAALPCLAAWGPTTSLAVADVDVEPTGADQTFWVTDAVVPVDALEASLGRDGVAAELMADIGGLRLFRLAGFYQPGDARLARAPGRLSGVIGAAPEPFDLDLQGT
jgi:chorismate mutase